MSKKVVFIVPKHRAGVNYKFNVFLSSVLILIPSLPFFNVGRLLLEYGDIFLDCSILLLFS